VPVPKIDVVPVRPAVRSDASTTLDVLVRVTPPESEGHFVRPAINLGLVLDHSGSMSGGKKMEYARQAASFAVEQLLPSDRVSVTIFDSDVETIVPSTLATNKPALLAAIRRVQAEDSTALHAGWKAGAEQVRGFVVPQGLNRVLLLSDGLANVGVTDPNVIAGDAGAFAREGVSTTAMGVGNDFNEDLMEAMALKGDGNYYFIESPRQLPDIYQTELQGLMATVGRMVSLGIEPCGGVTVSDVLNDFDKNDRGRCLLPNLVVGMPVQAVVRLVVPPLSGYPEVCRFRLAWDDPRSPGRHVLWGDLGLHAVSSSRWDELPEEPAVQEQVALLMAARAKKEAVAALDRRDLASTRRWVEQAAGYACMAPSGDVLAEELAQIAAIQTDLEQGDLKTFRKRTTAQSYTRRQSKPST
jgi:Ca-activated chloride channel family protein